MTLLVAVRWGGSLEKLRVILGHSTTEVTMRYGHLVQGQFSAMERARRTCSSSPARCSR